MYLDGLKSRVSWHIQATNVLYQYVFASTSPYIRQNYFRIFFVFVCFCALFVYDNALCCPSLWICVINVSQLQVDSNISFWTVFLQLWAIIIFILTAHTASVDKLLARAWHNRNKFDALVSLVSCWVLLCHPACGPIYDVALHQNISMQSSL